jgi:hypothetical protein
MNISQLTASPAQAKILQNLGINVPAFLLHYKTQSLPEVWVISFFRQNTEQTLPAWTKEEIDAMIGPEFSKPDLWKPDKLGKEQDPESYPVYYPDKMRIFKKGAEASADALIFLLQNKHVRAYDANQRYTDLFLKDVNNKG